MLCCVFCAQSDNRHMQIQSISISHFSDVHQHQSVSDDGNNALQSGEEGNVADASGG